MNKYLLLFIFILTSYNFSYSQSDTLNIHFEDGETQTYDISSGLTIEIQNILSVENINDAKYQIKSNPNPFNEVTNIKFHSDLEEKLDIKIYDIRGNIVKNFALDNYTKEEVLLQWDGTDNDGNKLTSGVYTISKTGTKSTSSTTIIISR